MSRPQTTDFDRKNPRTGVHEQARHLRTFADKQEANAANMRAMQAMQEIAEAEGVRVVAHCFAEHREDGDLQNIMGGLIYAKSGDLVAAHAELGSQSAVLNHAFKRLAETLLDDNKKG